MTGHHSLKKRATINDIARISGYSKTAVSFAFNDPSRISRQACDTILGVAETLGYYPDPLARKFSLQRHESIGFLLPQELRFSFRNPYIMQVVEGIGDVCQERGNTLTLIPPLNASVIAAVRTAAVDAMIIQGMSANMEIAESIGRRGIPFVSIDGIPSEEMPSVNIDDRQAAYDIMHTVLESGHREIAIIGLSDVSYERSATEGIQKRRMEGYLEALREVGLDYGSPSITVFKSECTVAQGRQVVDRILTIPRRPTCIVTMSDIVAIGCMFRLPELGLRVPRDISVVGFDNIDETNYTLPGLTTVHQPSKEKGVLAARLLFRMLGQTGEDRGDIHVRLPHHLVIRDSLSRV